MQNETTDIIPEKLTTRQVAEIYFQGKRKPNEIAEILGYNGIVPCGYIPAKYGKNRRLRLFSKAQLDEFNASGKLARYLVKNPPGVTHGMNAKQVEMPLAATPEKTPSEQPRKYARVVDGSIPKHLTLSDVQKITNLRVVSAAYLRDQGIKPIGQLTNGKPLFAADEIELFAKTRRAAKALAKKNQPKPSKATKAPLDADHKQLAVKNIIAEFADSLIQLIGNK